MSRDAKQTGWRRWREVALATCAVWLVIQNLALLAVVVWASPGSALAAGAAIARTAFDVGGQLVVLALAAVMALALAAWLVQAPGAEREEAGREVNDGW